MKWCVHSFWQGCECEICTETIGIGASPEPRRGCRPAPRWRGLDPAGGVLVTKRKSSFLAPRGLLTQPAIVLDPVCSPEVRSVCRFFFELEAAKTQWLSRRGLAGADVRLNQPPARAAAHYARARRLRALHWLRAPARFYSPTRTPMAPPRAVAVRPSPTYSGLSRPRSEASHAE